MRSLYFLGGVFLTFFSLKRRALCCNNDEHDAGDDVRFDACFDTRVEANRLHFMSVLTFVTKLTVM